MPSNYARIAEENTRKYGTDIGRYGPVLLAQLYSDRTHFVYELLQNAEDASATKVTFRLFSNRLEVIHDGRVFNEADVRGICGLVEGTKAGDLNKIGKFGIGFKSVFGYTDSPEIHSLDEHFRIGQYVHPEAAEPRIIPPSATTVFVFPFDRAEVTPEDSVGQIGERLASLSPRTLLFLKNIMEISWEIEGDASGTYLRERKKRGTASHVVVVGETQDQEMEENWLVFERPVSAETGELLKVEVAFRLEREPKTNKEYLIAARDSRLVVFFPTEKVTNLQLMIQGPYRTTPARDNIPAEDDWNKKLIQETASLVAESILQIRQMGLLSVSLLEALPIEESYRYGMFGPIFESVKKALGDHPLLPASAGGFVIAGSAKLARGTGLRELLSDLQLKELLASKLETKWLSDEITEDKTPRLRAYLRRELSVEEITPEMLANRFSSSFIQTQTDEWVVKFYRFLVDQEAIWRKSRYNSDRPGPLRDKPFIRLEDANHVAPFRKDGVPNAYLPSEEVTEFPTVKRKIVSDAQAKEFLEKLGLGEPDIVAEVLENVLPKYASQQARNIGDEEHRRDIQLIIRALQTDSASKKQNLTQKLKETPFLSAIDMETGNIAYKRPVEIYACTKELETYFGKWSAWLIAEPEHLEETGRKMDWSILGVEDKPRRIPWPASLKYEEKRELRRNEGFTREIEVSDFNLDGLVPFLADQIEAPVVEAMNRALILWNFLLQHIDSLPSWNKKGFFHGQYKWYYYNQRSAAFDATFVKLLRGMRWLPSIKGELCAPASMSLDDLPQEFKRDDLLISTFQIRPSVLRSLAQEFGVNPEDIDIIRTHPDEFARFKESLQKEPEQDGDGQINENETGDENGSTLDYKKAFQEVFGHPQVREPVGTFSGSAQVANPELRRQRTQEEIQKDRDGEPKREMRFERVSRKVWEAKDSNVRTFLKQEYNGDCQICGKTFTRRDGEPYFEGLYLVSHTRARWIDRPGNVLCLCPTCCAKLLYGAIEAPDILEQVMAFRARKEGGTGEPSLLIKLCDEDSQLGFTEKHLLDLQELLKASSAND